MYHMCKITFVCPLQWKLFDLRQANSAAFLKLEAVLRVPLLVPAVALTTGKIASLMDILAQLSGLYKLYTYLCPVVT